MITQLETAFNITVDNDKAVSNLTGEPTHPDSSSISTFVDRQLTYSSNLSYTADLDVGRGPTRPDTL